MQSLADIYAIEGAMPPVYNPVDLINHPSAQIRHIEPEKAKQFINGICLKAITLRFDIPIKKEIIEQWSKDLVEAIHAGEYRDMKLVEIKTLLRRMSKSTIYRRIDANVLTNELDSYWEERCQIVYNEKRRRNNELKYNTIEGIVPATVEVINKLKWDEQKEKHQYRNALIAGLNKSIRNIEAGIELRTQMMNSEKFTKEEKDAISNSIIELNDQLKAFKISLKTNIND